MSETPSIFQHILAPTDGSQPAAQAGRMAIRLAAFHKSRLTFVYVVDGSIAASLAGASKKDIKEVLAELEESGRRSLDYLARIANGAGISSEQIIRKGEACAEITKVASEQEADLIVIGQVGSHGLRRVLIGNVTEDVIENSPCPVLVINKTS